MVDFVLCIYYHNLKKTKLLRGIETSDWQPGAHLD